MMTTVRKLARTLKKFSRDADNDPNLSLPTADDSRPIDFEEQEEMVRTFERIEAQQSRQWRIVFTTLLCCYMAFLFYSIYQQVMYPWELRYHAYFMEDIDSRVVILADWVAVLSCSLTILGVHPSSKQHRKWIWYSCSIGALLALFWLNYMTRLPKFRWDVIWLPLGPLSWSVICLYVDHLLDQSSEEVQKLRSYMYAYKAR